LLVVVAEVVALVVEAVDDESCESAADMSSLVAFWSSVSEVMTRTSS
jgi:hypothetical protein